MGIPVPVEDGFREEVPATPPGVRDGVDEECSEDDLFAESKETTEEKKTFGVNNGLTINYNNDLSTINYKYFLPLPYNLTGDLKTTWNLHNPPKKNNKYCSGCAEDVKKDLKKLNDVVLNYKNERDALKTENEVLKKELEELRKILKNKEEQEKGVVQVTVSNYKQGEVNLFVKKDCFENKKSASADERNAENYRFGNNKSTGVINSLSVNLQEHSQVPETINRSKKTIAELRREFFAKEFQSEQTSFTSKSYLEIKPEEKKETVRSKLSLRVRPKQKISEIISKLSSKLSDSKIIPQAPQINLFQRFEKTKIIWEKHEKLMV